MIKAAMSCSAVGAPDTVERETAAFVEQTSADEIMVTSNIHDHAKRLRSFELVAEMMGSTSELQRSALTWIVGRSGRTVVSHVRFSLAAGYLAPSRDRCAVSDHTT